MLTFKASEEIRAYFKSKSERIGLVPTMGALHSGHLSLVRKACAENDYVVISVYINPTQFNYQIDLESYPSNLSSDIALLDPFSDKIIFYTPDHKDLYPEKIQSKSYDFGSITAHMEGLFRPGHFNGVATVIEALFRNIQPQKAYFGEKDFQQLLIIRNLVIQKKIKTKIIGCEIVRGKNGLALSSRNILLDEHELKLAPILYQTLIEAKKLKNKLTPREIIKYVEKKLSFFPSLSLEYFIIADENSLTPIDNFNINKKIRTFIAVKFGKIRLIDNLQF